MARLALNTFRAYRFLAYLDNAAQGVDPPTSAQDALHFSRMSMELHEGEPWLLLEAVHAVGQPTLANRFAGTHSRLIVWCASGDTVLRRYNLTIDNHPMHEAPPKRVWLPIQFDAMDDGPAMDRLALPVRNLVHADFDPRDFGVPGWVALFFLGHEFNRHDTQPAPSAAEPTAPQPSPPVDDQGEETPPSSPDSGPITPR